MLRKSRIASIFLLALSLLLLWQSCLRVFATTSVEVSSDIEATRERITSFYQTLAAAEKSGGNISSLLAKLNNASNALSVAIAYCKEGNFDLAIHYNNLANEQLIGFEDEANKLSASAPVEEQQKLYQAIVISTVGIVLTMVLGFLIRHFVMKRYVREVLKKKPVLPREQIG